MRFAAIADVHGNYLALEAVVADIRAAGIDRHRQSRRHGKRTARCAADHGRADGARRRSRARQPRPLSDRPAAGADGVMGPALRMRSSMPDHLDWLRAVPPTLVYRDRVFLCHATPASDEVYWLETVLARRHGADVLARGDRSRRRRNRAAAHPLRPQPYCARGPARRRPPDRQSRQRRLARLSRQPSVPHVIEAGTPDARYAILEFAGGCWRITFRHVPYDHQAMAALARRNGQPELASALATGWIR